MSYQDDYNLILLPCRLTNVPLDSKMDKDKKMIITKRQNKGSSDCTKKVKWGTVDFMDTRYIINNITLKSTERQTGSVGREQREVVGGVTL